MATFKLTNLPIELQSLIVNKLSDPERDSSSHFLSCRGVSFNKLVWKCLPDDLLHAAQASPVLAKAVIHAIGPRARSSSFRQTKRLWEWICILQGYIKAVDFDGVGSLDSLSHMNIRETPFLDSQIEGDVQDQATFKTLEALHSNEVQLEELNLTSLELFDPRQAKKMSIYMERAIERSCSSLKEIHLPANQASVQAMKNVTLPKLSTVHISTDICSDTFEIQNSCNPFSSEKAMCQILKAIHEKTDHTSRVSLVRELNLNMLFLVPKIKFKTCPSLFLSVKKLSLTFHYDSDQRAVAKFISNFKNLESLEWPASIQVIREVKNMETIFAACNHLNDLNLSRKSLSRRTDEIGIPRNFTIMNDFFASFRGQLQKVNLRYLTREQIKVLGETNPNLSTLYLCIDQDTVEALSLLLGNHCRKLCELHLEYSRHTDHCLDKHSWSAINNAIQIASSSFNTISLIDSTQDFDRTTEDMVDAIINIIEVMGDHAREVRVKISMKTNSPVVLLKGLCRTLKSAVLHSKSIHRLCFDFFPGYACHLFGSQEEKDEIKHWYEAVCKLRNVLSNFRYLKEIDVGNIAAIHRCYIEC